MILKTIVDARFCLVRAKFLATLGDIDEAENEELRAYEKAHSIGWVACRTGSELPIMFKRASGFSGGRTGSTA